jgi:predicted PurR-regulated permease PerM
MTVELCNNLAAKLEKVNYFGNSILESNVIIYTIIASIIASFGFLHNTSVPIIGSMVISPVLSPLYNVLSKYISNNKSSNILSGIGFHIFLLGICGLIGFISVSLNEWIKLYPEETEQMQLLTTYKHIITDVVISSMCGIGIAFAILRGDVITRVGFSIAITILPAMVNFGMYLGLFYHSYLKNNKDKQNEYLYKCKKTLKLTVLNILACMLFSFIFLSGYCYYVKHLG